MLTNLLIATLFQFLYKKIDWSEKLKIQVRSLYKCDYEDT